MAPETAAPPVPPPPASPAAASPSVEVAGLVSWEWDILGHELRCSGNAAAVLGLEAERVRRPEDLWACIPPEDRAAHESAIDRALASWQGYSCQFRWTRPDDGRVLWLEERAGVVDDGRGLRAAGVLIDVSERKAMEAVREDIRRRAEELLARQRAEQQAILDSVRALILYKDCGNRILRCNRTAAQWLGLRVDQIEGRRAEDLFPGEAATYHSVDREVIETGRPKLGVIAPLKTFDGSTRWVQTDKIPHRDEAGEIIGVVVFCLDVTERVQAEQVLRESEQTQREFVANVSHEFRTPVAAIKGFAETLRTGGLEDARQRGKFVRIIENHANRLQWLIEDLLTLSSLESGTVKLKPEPIVLRDFVDEYAMSVDSLVRKAGLTLTVDIAASARVMADQAHFLHALENLIGNAIKYNRKGGRVRV